MFNIFKKLNQEINLDVRSSQLIKQYKEKRYEHMKEIYSNIHNPFIPDPSSNFHENIYKYLPILDIKSHRLLRLMVLKKFPGVEVACKLCNELTRSFFKHIDECSALNPSVKTQFLQLKALNSQD